jgi:hypothetical protein
MQVHIKQVADRLNEMISAVQAGDVVRIFHDEGADMLLMTDDHWGFLVRAIDDAHDELKPETKADIEQARERFYAKYDRYLQTARASLSEE